MRVLIRYLNGTEQPAIVIAEIGSRLRVAIPGCDDAVEFTSLEGLWICEDGEPARIDWSAAADPFDWDLGVGCPAIDPQWDAWPAAGLWGAPRAFIN